MGTRTLVLVRHGQYLAETGHLTDLGREQAQITATHLADRLEEPVAKLTSSTLVRAKETAAIVGDAFPNVKPRAVSVLREGMYSRVKGHEVPESERREDRARADAAFARFFRTSARDRLELLVCHGNLIRYLVCLAMEIPALRWTRMNSHHCAVTRILVRGTGAIRVVSYNETAHLPSRLIT